VLWSNWRKKLKEQPILWKLWFRAKPWNRIHYNLSELIGDSGAKIRIEVCRNFQRDASMAAIILSLSASGDKVALSPDARWCPPPPRIAAIAATSSPPLERRLAFVSPLESSVIKTLTSTPWICLSRVTKFSLSENFAPREAKSC